jgi:hypothetical protein
MVKVGRTYGDAYMATSAIRGEGAGLHDQERRGSDCRMEIAAATGLHRRSEVMY